MKNKVSAAWLNEHLADEALLVVTANLAATASGAQTDLDAKTIPNARHFDLNNTFSNPKSAFPNTLTTPEPFDTECRKLGVNSD